ncbi:MAG: hypothetical protein N2171_07760 [Clostridia bacterium]|nr:hypothetical protein [Clostridia bacterium]
MISRIDGGLMYFVCANNKEKDEKNTLVSQEDSVELSDAGILLSDMESKSDKFFADFDRQSAELRKESLENAERLKKQLKQQEETRKLEREKIELKEALMEDTGLLWTSGLTAQSQQIIKQKAPELRQRYEEKQKGFTAII